jgi:hypothetical protein
VLGEPQGPFDADAALDPDADLHADGDGAVVREAVSRVLAEMAKWRPELQFTAAGE